MKVDKFTVFLILLDVIILIGAILIINYYT